MSEKEQLEVELLENEWEQKFLSDKSGYWFRKEFKFPVFDVIEVTYSPSEGLLSFEIKSGDEYAEVAFEKIKTYKQINNIIREQLKF